MDKIFSTLAQAIIDLDYCVTNGHEDGLEGATLHQLRLIANPQQLELFDEEDRGFDAGARDLVREGRAVSSGGVVTLLKEVTE